MQTKLATPESGVNGQYVDASAARNARDAAASGISREFHNFIADVEDLIQATTSLTGEELYAARAKLNNRIAAARDSVADVTESVTQRVRKSAAVTNQYVHDQPWQAVGIGAAVGVLLGFVIGRRS